MTSAIEAPQAQVSEGLSSSVFEIVSPANIPADKSGHKARECLYKVTVAKIRREGTGRDSTCFVMLDIVSPWCWCISP